MSLEKEGRFQIYLSDRPAVFKNFHGNGGLEIPAEDVLFRRPPGTEHPRITLSGT